MGTYNLKKPTVLVVDDVETNLLILEEILKDNYSIITARNGVEALDILHKAETLPKIILLDIFMPEMNGYEMLDIMKKHDTFKRIPVIFITTSDAEIDALSAGAVDFISKPFLPEIVKLRVANQIELKNYSDSLEAMVEQKAAEITSTLDNMLQAMANIIEYRNLESGSHVKRTFYFSQVLVDYLLEHSEYADELRSLEPEIIVKSVPLHDIGKIGIPDKILLKPGRLLPEEFEIIKTHTTIGKDIIESILNLSDTVYLQHCRDICYCHHERFDGKGYPQGLKGRDIPLSARILSIVDVYDALVCARVYKEAYPYEEAIKIIAEGRGTQFDPIITDAVLELQDRFKEISKQYQ
ncbi:HD-GYP domain-containing protein [Breznakiella homolactica]|uniref:Response regulator n=1 Tax=Breznakiella homolactica TaxID=2798577 RepID=A0A7T7XLM4_9SPIR|nr:HD domain-containing phosphohydrolase [Breznakiella homolactica]QQO08575.1 response regulator [Breznakiella homolactica]